MRKATTVVTILVSMTLILAAAGAVMAVVMIGMEGRWRRRFPRLADRLGRTAERLNGETDSEQPQPLA